MGGSGGVAGVRDGRGAQRGRGAGSGRVPVRPRRTEVVGVLSREEDPDDGQVWWVMPRARFVWDRVCNHAFVGRGRLRGVDGPQAANPLQRQEAARLLPATFFPSAPPASPLW